MIGWICALALAAPGDPDWEAPALSAESWAPPTDASGWMLTHDSQAREGWVARLDTTWSHRPLVWLPDEGDDPIAIVRDAAISWWTVGAALGRVGLSATAPVVLVVHSEVEGSAGPLAGDPSLQGRVVAIEGSERPGLSLFGRLRAPTGAHRRQLGVEGWSWELGLATDLRVGPVQIAADAAGRGLPRSSAGELQLDDQLAAHLGARVGLRPQLQAQAELHGHLPTRRADLPGAHSLELLGSVRGRIAADLWLQGGGGIPISMGLGSPALRLFLSLQLRPSGPQEPIE